MRFNTKKLLIFILILISLTYSDVINSANPDLISSGLEYNTTMTLMIGEEVSFKGFNLSALVHVRNEERYNTHLFPNHNWRGVIFLKYFADSLLKSLPFTLFTGIEHESAHPTMGICGNETNPYEMIYDNSYRRYLLNSILLGATKTINLKQISLLLDLEYRFYFYSKNTPELSGMQDAISNGISGGLEFRFNLKEQFLFLSIFDRIIFEGNENANGLVHTSVTENTTLKYPIINSINTLKGKLGVSLNLKKIKRRLNIYTALLNGNIYGFVDSREKRLVYTIIGIEILH